MTKIYIRYEQPHLKNIMIFKIWMLYLFLNCCFYWKTKKPIFLFQTVQTKNRNSWSVNIKKQYKYIFSSWFPILIQNILKFQNTKRLKNTMYTNTIKKG